MKRFSQHILPSLLLWGEALLLAVPNVAMSIMAHMQLHAALANVLLPLGLYLLLLSLWRNVGRTVLAICPLAVMAAFQIVLLYLYGDGSVIAVDMFLNVATTNGSEAMELLGNLASAVILVLVMYLPPLAIGAWLCFRGTHTPPRTRRVAAWTGGGIMAVGVAAMCSAYLTVPHYSVVYDVFPVNAFCNLEEAVSRNLRTADYANTSALYTFGARREPGITYPGREVYLAVIGETSRADNYQLYGYPRFTTPLLAGMDTLALVACDRVLSESNTTHKSVPMLLATLDSEQYNDSIYSSKSVITAFREAGFRTAFVTMQSPNGSFIDFFGQEADSVISVRRRLHCPSGTHLSDLEALPVIDSLLASAPANDKLLIVLHLYGSHFNYTDRYPRTDAFFLPDKVADAVPANRPTLINAYDNSLRQTDRLLYSLTQRLDSLGCPCAMIYTSDHGEDIFDDERMRFLHASPTPTFMQLHVPLIMWFNEPYRAAWTKKWRAALATRHKDISSSESFAHTLLHMASIASPRLKEDAALTSDQFVPVQERRFLNDRNRSVNLQRAGFAEPDYRLMQPWNNNY